MQRLLHQRDGHGRKPARPPQMVGQRHRAGPTAKLRRQRLARHIRPQVDQQRRRHLRRRWCRAARRTAHRRRHPRCRAPSAWLRPAPSCRRSAARSASAASPRSVARRCADQIHRESHVGRRAAARSAQSGSSDTQAPSEPSRGQDAPPSANTVARGRSNRSPSGVAKRNAPSARSPTSDAASATPRHAPPAAPARRAAAATPSSPSETRAPNCR